MKGCLAEYSPIMLEAIADGWGIALTDEQASEIVDRLVVEITSREAVRVVVQRLSDIEQEALAFIAAVGQAKAHVLGCKYGSIRRLGPGRLEWEQAWRNPASALERLWFLGLIYRAYAVDEKYHGEVFFIPSEILAVLPALSAPLPVFQVDPAPPPPVVCDDRNALIHDAFVILSYLRNHDVRAKRGVLASHELANLRLRLVNPDPQRLLFVHRICERAGLIQREESLWQPTGHAASWLKEGSLARSRAFYCAWLEDAHWNELRMMPSVHCEDTGWHNDPILARKGVLGHLAKCPIDVWLTISSLEESIHEVEPDFMRPDGDYDSWYIRDVHTGQYLMGYGKWSKVEGAYIRYLLEYPLRWLGVLAIGYAQEGGNATCFRLTEAGAGILRARGAKSADVYSARDEGDALHPIVVHANFQVTVSCQASLYDRFLLERFARWVEEKHGLALYVIAADSVRACLQRGITVRQIVAFLRRVTRGQVPNQVLRALKSWANVHERLL